MTNMDVNIIWDRVRQLNDRSQLCTEMADWLTQLANEIEENNKA